MRSLKVRAVSGSILGIFEMSRKDTVYDAKARLDGAPGRHHLLAAEGQVSDAVALGSLAQEERLLLTAVRRRLGFALAAQLDGSLTMWDLEQKDVVQRMRCSLCQPQTPT
ncbi:poc1b, partial [Symbiodinium microadriaticum]